MPMAGRGSIMDIPPGRSSGSGSGAIIGPTCHFSGGIGRMSFAAATAAGMAAGMAAGAGAVKVRRGRERRMRREPVDLRVDFMVVVDWG